MQTSDIISLEQVSYLRKGNYILKDIDWKIERYQHWILFGPNGAGKTTLLQIIMGYILPSKGNARILGEILGRTNIPELRKKIGWVSNALQTLVHGEDPAIEIVVAGKFAMTRLWVRAEEEDWIKAQGILDTMGCADIANKPYGILSQGEQKKVMIARAMMNDPVLLVLDEPCEGLDIAAREKFLNSIKNLDFHTNGTHIIFVTHYVEEILDIFTHTLLIKSGEVYAQGPTENIINTQCLSSLFELDIKIEKINGRYSAHIA